MAVWQYVPDVPFNRIYLEMYSLQYNGHGMQWVAMVLGQELLALTVPSCRSRGLDLRNQSDFARANII
jgi:hypothetical protein